VRKVGLKELRQEASEVVRRVGSGEQVGITAAGRLAARLAPASSKRWWSCDAIAAVFSGPPDPMW
jgi:prevent-host-death family protein